MGKGLKITSPKKSTNDKRLGRFGRWLNNIPKGKPEWPVKVKYRMIGDENRWIYASSFKSIDHFNKWYIKENHRLYDITMPDGEYKKYGEGVNPTSIKFHPVMQQKSRLLRNVKIQ